MKADPEQCPLDRVCEIGVCEEGLLCTGGYSCAGPTQMYVMSLYFAICSVSGVGAVIATPYNTTEQLLAGFIHLLTGMLWVRAAERSYRLPHSSHLFSPHLISTSHLLTPPHTSSHLHTDRIITGLPHRRLHIPRLQLLSDRPCLPRRPLAAQFLHVDEQPAERDALPPARVISVPNPKRTEPKASPHSSPNVSCC